MSDRKVTPAPKAYRANVFWDRQDCATLSAQVYLASDADSFIGALLAERDQLRAELEAADEQKERWVAWAKELGEKCDRLEAELAAIRGQQPVAWVSPDAVGGTRWKAGALQQLNDGSPLYALPPQQPDAVSDSWPPFAKKVLAKMQRFCECAEDCESGGVDIGRPWLDLLTKLELLNRVQRSPALWEISQQGEDLLTTNTDGVV